MKITFPPNDPSEAGTWRNSRLYEALPNTFPAVTYFIMFWCITAHWLASQQGGDNWLEFMRAQNSLGGMNVLDPWGEPVWKYLGACFLHGDLIHLVFNMMWIYQLCPLMERGLGSFKTLLFVVVTGFASSAFQTSFEGAGIGMSGVVYALVGFMWAAWPRWTGFLEKFRGQTVQFLLFWQVICIFISMGDISYMKIGNTAHISGMIVGGVIGLWACWGNKRGAKWMAVSALVVGASIAVALWSPWNIRYRFHKMESRIDLNPIEKHELKAWQSDRDEIKPQP